jgi:hypothetical protein
MWPLQTADQRHPDPVIPRAHQDPCTHLDKRGTFLGPGNVRSLATHGGAPFPWALHIAPFPWALHIAPFPWALVFEQKGRDYLLSALGSGAAPVRVLLVRAHLLVAYYS